MNRNYDMLCTKIDFLGLLGVSLANPNGDPLRGGIPRTDSHGYGIISDVCIKHKLRERLADLGEDILVQTGADSLEQRLSCLGGMSQEELIAAACGKWYDVRAFGQVFFGMGKRAARSASVRGAVCIQHALSVHPVEVMTLPVTRCVSGRSAYKASDTLGGKSIVRYGLYLLKGSVCAGAAARNGFTRDDCIKLKSALSGLFSDDASAARPEGSIVMERLYWWEHPNMLGSYPTAKVHATVVPRLREKDAAPLCFSDYIIEEQHLDGLTPEIIC